MMLKTMAAVTICITAFVTSAAAQTINKIPKYTSSTTFGDSAITELNGNVGIGTTTPRAQLDLESSSGASVVLGYPSWTNSAKSTIAFDFGGYVASIQGVADYSSGTNLVFNTNETQSISSPSTTMRLNGGGQVQIGSNPDTIAGLDIENTPSWVRPGVARGMMLQQALTAYPGLSTGSLTALEINPTFNDNNSTGITHNGLLVDAGNVGIGTPAPVSTLHVDNTTAVQTTALANAVANSSLVVQSYGSTSYQALAFGSISPNVQSIQGIYLNSTSASAPIVLNPYGGNVGIGTTLPGYKLDISGGQVNSTGGYCISGSCITSWPTTGTNTWTGIQTFSGVTNFPSGVWNANGNVGIGTTTAGSPLTVGGTGDPAAAVSVTYGGQYAIEGVNNSCNGNYCVVVMNGHIAGIYGATNNPDGSGGFFTNTGSGSALITGTGNVGIGTSAPGQKLDVAGNIKLTGTGASIYFPDGTVQSSAYTGVICGGDYAESVDVIGDRKHYEPGDVLVIDVRHPGKFLKASEPYSKLIAGIYSTKPGTVGRRQTTLKSPEEVPMALVGIVPIKASAENGTIKTGDLLVTSSKLGYAMKGTDSSKLIGAVIGKALGPLDSGTGVIEVLVTLQ